MSGDLPVRRKMLDPTEILRAAGRVAVAAEKQRVRAALVGGMAMQCYGSPRLTGDLDIVLADTIDGFRGKELTFGGTRTKIGKVPTDLIVRSDKWAPLYEAAVASSVSVEDLPIRIVLPGYLAAMKMVAGRDKDSLDLEYLVLENKSRVDEMRRVVVKHMGEFAADEFDRAVDVARWKRSKGIL